MDNCFIIKEIVCTRGLSGCIVGRYFFVFDRGVLELKNNYKKTRFFYYAVFVNNNIKTDNYFYNSTLKDEIKSFLVIIILVMML